MAGAAGPERASTLASVVVRNSMMTKPRASWTLLSARCTSPQTPKASTLFLQSTVQSRPIKLQTLNPTYFLRPAKPYKP